MVTDGSFVQLMHTLLCLEDGVERIRCLDKTIAIVIGCFMSFKMLAENNHFCQLSKFIMVPVFPSLAVEFNEPYFNPHL